MNIVISCRRDPTPYGSFKDCVEVEWWSYFNRYHPCDLVFPVPNSSDMIWPWLQKIVPDLIILSGGNDVGQCQARDQTEAKLLSWSLEYGCPVIGICRGMQFLYHSTAGKLIAVEAEKHVAQLHSLVPDASCPVVLPESVNSYHQFAPLEDDHLPWNVWARSEDGSPELICHVDNLWLGIMWHPERDQSLDLKTQNLIRYFMHNIAGMKK